MEHSVILHVCVICSISPNLHAEVVPKVSVDQRIEKKTTCGTLHLSSSQTRNKQTNKHTIGMSWLLKTRQDSKTLKQTPKNSLGLTGAATLAKSMSNNSLSVYQEQQSAKLQPRQTKTMTYNAWLHSNEVTPHAAYSTESCCLWSDTGKTLA